MAAPPTLERSTTGRACAQDAVGCVMYNSHYSGVSSRPARMPRYKPVPWPCRPGVDYKEDPARHVVITSDESPYTTWMSRVAFHSWCAAIMDAKGRLGADHKFPTFTQLLYSQRKGVGGPGDDVRDPFTGQAPGEVMPTWEWMEVSPFHVELTADFPVYSRAIVLLNWMGEKRQRGNDSFWTLPDVSVAVYEPDMLFRKVYYPDAFTGKKGTVLGPHNDFLRPPVHFNNRILGKRHCAPTDACNNIVGLDVPWIFERDDLWKVLPDWLLLTRAMRVDKSPSLRFNNYWLADMFAMEFAAVRRGVTTTIAPATACHAVDSKPRPCNSTQAMHYVANIGGSRGEGPYVFNKHAHHDTPPPWDAVLVKPGACDAQLLRKEKSPCDGCNCEHLATWREFGEIMSAALRHHFHPDNLLAAPPM